VSGSGISHTALKENITTRKSSENDDNHYDLTLGFLPGVDTTQVPVDSAESPMELASSSDVNVTEADCNTSQRGECVDC